MFYCINLQLHVIQVQQWLTDISATRGAPGYDDGYDDMGKHMAASVTETSSTDEV